MSEITHAIVSPREGVSDVNTSRNDLVESYHNLLSDAARNAPSFINERKTPLSMLIRNHGEAALGIPWESAHLYPLFLEQARRVEVEINGDVAPEGVDINELIRQITVESTTHEGQHIQKALEKQKEPSLLSVIFIKRKSGHITPVAYIHFEKRLDPLSAVEITSAPERLSPGDISSIRKQIRHLSFWQILGVLNGYLKKRLTQSK